MTEFICANCGKRKSSNYSLKSHPRNRSGKIICWECYNKQSDARIRITKEERERRLRERIKMFENNPGYEIVEINGERVFAKKQKSDARSRKVNRDGIWRI